MTSDDIKFKTIQAINGLKHLGPKQVEDIKHIICFENNLEKTEENFNIIQEGISLYFKTINSYELHNN